MIAFLITGSKKEGLGHIFRTLSLIQILKEKNLPYTCFTNQDPVLSSLIPSHNITELTDHFFETQKAITLVIDTRHDMTAIILLAKKHTVPVVQIDCLNNSRLLADINIYPNPHFPYKTLDWTGYSGRCFSGADYTPIHTKFLHTKNHLPQLSERHRILISFGGSDPNHLTPKILGWLESENLPWPIDIIIGPAFTGNIPKTTGTIYQNCQNISPIMAKAGILITSLGTTIYEAAILKLPTIIISNFKEDARDETSLSKFEGFFPLGYYQTMTKIQLLTCIKKCIENHARNSQQIGTLIDGKGTRRIIDLICQL